MEQVKLSLKALLKPPVWLTAVLTTGGAGALVWVFLEGYDTRWFAYPIYVLAFYALVVVCIRLIPWTVRRIKNRRNEAPDETARAGKLRSHLKKHLVVDLLYGLGQVVQGVIAGSAWIGGNGLYNACCGLAHAVMLGYERKLERIREERERRQTAWRCYCVCGALLTLVNLTMTGLAFQMIWMGRGGHDSEIMVIAMAAFTFYKLILGIIRVLRSRGADAPISGAVRNLNLAQAMMSLFSLQAALLAVYGGEEKLQLILNSLTGFAVCLMTMLGSIGMVIHGRRKLRQLQGEERYGTQ